MKTLAIFVVFLALLLPAVPMPWSLMLAVLAAVWGARRIDESHG